MELDSLQGGHKNRAKSTMSDGARLTLFCPPCRPHLTFTEESSFLIRCSYAEWSTWNVGVFWAGYGTGANRFRWAIIFWEGSRPAPVCHRLASRSKNFTNIQLYTNTAYKNTHSFYFSVRNRPILYKYDGNLWPCQIVCQVSAIRTAFLITECVHTEFSTKRKRTSGLLNI